MYKIDKTMDVRCMKEFNDHEFSCVLDKGDVFLVKTFHDC